MSTLRVNTLQNTSGVEVYTAKAWVNFNGTGTVAIRASGNVTSITDNATGDYTINFTTAMPDINYAASGMAASTATPARTVAFRNDASHTTTSVRIATFPDPATGLLDSSLITVAVFR